MGFSRFARMHDASAPNAWQKIKARGRVIDGG
jgi:hypothetical protein